MEKERKLDIKKITRHLDVPPTLGSNQPQPAETGCARVINIRVKVHYINSSLVVHVARGLTYPL